MSKKTGIPVKKIKKLDKTVKADFRKIFTVFGKTAVMLGTGQPRAALKEAINFIEALQLSQNSSDLAYELILTALVNAAHNLAVENKYYFSPRFANAEQLYDEAEYAAFLEGITNLVEDKELELELEMLQKPRNIPILADFQTYFEQYLVLFGITAHDAENIAKRLPSFFVFALNAQWSKNFSAYEPLYQALNTPISAAARQERQWEAYNTYLEREVDLSIFGESFSLTDVFIPLRAYYQQKTKSREKATKEVVDLKTSMDAWLQSSVSKDTIRVIQGGPGSGKSSFVKWWVAQLAANKQIPVLFFPLHYFNIHTNIKTAIGEYLKDSDHTLDFNPLEDTRSFDKLLLVFDGLDELVMQGKSSKEAANAFMQELKTFCGLKNQSKQRVKVVVTGRPIVVQDVESKLRDSEEQIIRLLPYFLDDKQKEEYLDPNKLLAEDQRMEWWRRFFALKSMPQTALPKELQHSNMDKITAEPLLNYLVALSWQMAPEKFDQNANINAVYQQLIKRVYNRDWEKEGRHKGLGDLTPDDFMQILEEIAVCAWQGGDARITTERKIEEHIEGKGLQSLLNEYKASVKGGVSRLLTAFYFRKYGKEDSENKDDTFEFTHKSFGEYLTARAIVELIKATHEERTTNKNKSRSRRNRREGWTIEECLFEWLKTTCQSPLDKDIRAFIYNEILIRKEEGDDIRAWQKSLTEVISELVVTGMPLHRQKQRFDQLEEMRLARNAEEALLVALACCAEVTEQLSSIRWNDEESCSEWLRRLSSSMLNRDFAFRNLMYLNLEGVNLSGANLSGANLRGANLRGAFLWGANLRDANLRVANLGGANLSGANLSGANLGGANLRGANLGGANLRGANLRGTYLWGAYLWSAYLWGADLWGADLRGANLWGAYLRGAFLRGANLRDANLSGANLSGANLRRANLWGANLRDADLRGANLRDAYLWGADLRGAYLWGAYLWSAYLWGANLWGANLWGANLGDANLRGAYLTLEQLLSTRSLFTAKGINDDLLKQIKKEKPSLLDSSLWEDDGL